MQNILQGWRSTADRKSCMSDVSLDLNSFTFYCLFRCGNDYVRSFALLFRVNRTATVEVCGVISLMQRVGRPRRSLGAQTLMEDINHVDTSGQKSSRTIDDLFLSVWVFVLSSFPLHLSRSSSRSHCGLNS